MSRTTKKIKYTETIIFTFIWVVFFISPIVMSNIIDEINWRQIFNVWLRLSPFLLITLINQFFLIPYLFYQRKLWYFLSTLVLLVFLGTSLLLYWKTNPINFVNAEKFPADREVRRDPPPILRFENKPPGPDSKRPSQHLRKPRMLFGAWMPLLNSVFIGILILGFDLGLRTSFKWSRLEQQRTQLEKENIKNELAFLRNQLSPHFFMNTLNNIHSLIDIDTEEAKESIIRLSHLMRHLLYDSEDESIPLSKEVNFIQSYVELMKLRYTDKVKVSFTVDSDTSNISIPPLLFTSLIENAFKYGVSYKQKSFINIELFTKEKNLYFFVQNSKTDMHKSEGGIGLENTRKRLDLLYARNYEMKIEDAEKSYSIHLKLPL
ncbi:MAG: histidine kinase [Prolixibacteraceae bacterium]|jgi:two-component sensor histidine kinase|nr:histidine kinase [Prolixibacteraceae bacterium]